MVKFKRGLILSILFIVTLITGCSKKGIIEESIDFLTSDECAGRFVGTQGNKKAEEYIIDFLKSSNVEPYNDKYEMEYLQEAYIPEKQKFNFQINIDGKNKSLIYGKDYGVVSAKDVSGEYDLTDSVGDSSNKILVTEDNEQVDFSSSNIIAIKTDSIRAKPYYSNVNQCIIEISEEIYDLMIENLDATVSLDFSFQKETFQANNVVGKIKGENSKNAVIISNHFDHMGKVGESIWRGALDNASGVAATLALIENLNEEYKDSLPPFDIIFMFFNGEEIGVSGSNAIVSHVLKDYEKAFNINLDCVGLKNNRELALCSTNDKLGSSMEGYLSEHGIKAVANESTIGDGLSFKKYDVATLTFIEEAYTEIFHSLDDTAKVLDLDYIQEISNALSKFISKEAKAVLDELDEMDQELVSLVNNGENIEIDDNFKERLNIINKMNQLEYMYLNDGEFVDSIGMFSTNFDNEEAGKINTNEEFMKSMGFVYEMGDYEISYQLEFEIPPYEDGMLLDTVYKINPQVDNLDYMKMQIFTYNEDKMKCFYGELSKLSKEVYDEIYEDPSKYFMYVGQPSERPLGNSEDITIGDLKAKVIYGADNKTPVYIRIFVERDKNNYIISFTDAPHRESRFTDKDSTIQIIEEVGAINLMMEFVDRIEE